MALGRSSIFTLLNIFLSQIIRLEERPALLDNSLISTKLSSGIPNSNTQTIIKFRSFKNLNVENFIHDLQELPWCDLNSLENPNGLFYAFTQLLAPTLNRHIPLFKERRVRQNSIPWMTDDILEFFLMTFA